MFLITVIESTINVHYENLQKINLFITLVTEILKVLKTVQECPSPPIH